VKQVMGRHRRFNFTEIRSKQREKARGGGTGGLLTALLGPSSGEQCRRHLNR